MHPDREIFIQSLRQLGIPVTLKANLLTSNAIPCNYICNPDGSIRWVWPSRVRHADFLKFYHPSGFKAMLFVITASILAKLGMLAFLRGGMFKMYTSRPYTKDHRWAWFSGTAGPGRKAILWHLAPELHTGYFYKIPTGPLAAANLQREAETLKSFSEIHQTNIIVPASTIFSNDILKIQDIGQGTTRRNRFDQLPYNAVKTWLERGLRIQTYEASSFKIKLEEMISNLSLLNDHRIPNQMIKKLEVLLNSNPVPKTFISSNSHGDFTPWNVMIKAEKLHIIDLELSQNDMPALFDLFHFIYQSNILIGNNSYAAIRKELDRLFANPDFIRFFEAHQIDPAQAETMYLLYTIAYYLHVYAQQPQWHTQVNWLLKTWNEALSMQLQKHQVEAVRNTVLIDLGVLLRTKKYAALKWMYEGIETLPEDSDIDLCITHQDAKMLIKELKQHPLIVKIFLSRKSFMTQLELVCLDGSLIHIDLIYTFKRKAFVFLSAATLLDNTTLHPGGLKIPSKEENAEYIRLFYLLNHAEVPERYQPLLQITYSFPAQNKTEEYQKSRQNSGWRKYLHLAEYGMDTLRSCFSNHGFVITFSGVDGAGKSTVISHIQRLIDKRLRRKVVVLRHRPGLLPIISSWKYGKVQAEYKAANSLPRLGSNQNKWSSILRFGYYYLDYLIGQWFIQLRYVSQGYIVLYDRYYFDFINDAKRSNIVLPSSFTAWWYRFLVQPKLNFFLFADEQLIMERKQELDGQTIRKLTKSYLMLFDKLKVNSPQALYIPLENLQLSTTLTTVFNYIKLQHDESYH
ncbi:hypothetical protein [Pedobacter polysacchareus]|uniref:hypothetical protein n=1 Tax=Pedobacter polysacchareus TaxID=2861973 RepID=UPI001C99630A|nr:hypothetical protein [Pedobacter polysacchareus]